MMATLRSILLLAAGLCAGTADAQPPAAPDIPAPRAGEAVDTARAIQLREREAAQPVRPWTEPDPAAIPAGKAGDAIRYGQALLTRTSTLIGPNAPDPARRFAGNNLNCVANLYLQNLSNVSLDNLSVTGSGQQGINGNGVSGFSLLNSSVTSNGNESFEDGLIFQNLSGTVTITNTIIKNNAARQVHIGNNANNTGNVH